MMIMWPPVRGGEKEEEEEKAAAASAFEEKTKIQNRDISTTIIRIIIKITTADITRGIKLLPQSSAAEKSASAGWERRGEMVTLLGRHSLGRRSGRSGWGHGDGGGGGDGGVEWDGSSFYSRTGGGAGALWPPGGDGGGVFLLLWGGGDDTHVSVLWLYRGIIEILSWSVVITVAAATLPRSYLQRSSISTINMSFSSFLQEHGQFIVVVAYRALLILPSAQLAALSLLPLVCLF